MMGGATTIQGKTVLKEFTPTISLVAYTAGDQIGGLTKLENVLEDSSDSGLVMSIACIDKSKNQANIDLIFFDEEPTITSSDNDALDVPVADMIGKYLGRVRVNSSEYVDSANCSDATTRVIGLVVKGSTDAKAKDLWVVCQIADAKTYTSTSDLTFKVGVLQD